MPPKTQDTDFIRGQLPKGWTETTAEEYCLKVADGTHDSPKQSEEGKFLVTSKNLKNGQLDLSGSYKISFEDFKSINKRSKVDKWDILLGMIGTVGEVCLISDEPDFAIKNVGLFKCGDETKAKFLYYHLKSSLGQNYILSRLNGTTQKYITLGELRKFPIAMPLDPKEQRAIATVLSSFDDKIELLREENKTLEATAQTIFKEWFGKYKVEDELPEGWMVGKLGEIVKLLSGFPFKTECYDPYGEYKLVTIGNVNDGYFDPNCTNRIGKLPEKLPDFCKLQPGDILLSLTGNVGRVCITFGENYVLNQRVSKIVPNGGNHLSTGQNSNK